MTPHARHTGLVDPHAEGRALNDRQAAILEAVVTEYIGSAEPVGSSHVASAPGVQVSSATVRSEMVALERDGYLVQPHTSAGRIPTDKGYRFFVDHLTQPGVLGPTQHRQVCSFFDQVHGEMEDMLERATGLLSELTSYAAVVVGPSHDSATIRSVQVVGLAPRVALLVVVLSDGAVEKRTIDLDLDVDPSDEALSQAERAAQHASRRAHVLLELVRAAHRERGRRSGGGRGGNRLRAHRALHGIGPGLRRRPLAAGAVLRCR